MTFGEQVRASRNRLQLTQSMLATRCGVSVSFIQAIENGRNEPVLPHVLSLARELLNGNSSWKLEYQGAEITIRCSRPR